jgi:hypothetical protein
MYKHLLSAHAFRFDLDFDSPKNLEQNGNSNAYANQILTYGLLYA